jgi:hypothetical protein
MLPLAAALNLRKSRRVSLRFSMDDLLLPYRGGCGHRVYLTRMSLALVQFAGTRREIEV